MEDTPKLRDLLRRHDLSPAVLAHVDRGRVAQLRGVSRGVRANVDAVRGARVVELNAGWFAGLDGTAAEKRAAVMERLGALVATGAVIKELALPGTGLDGTEAALLAAITPALVRLDLRGNGVGVAGVRLLAEALWAHAALRELDLSNNRINLQETAGGAVETNLGSLRLAALLGQLPLTHLHLRGCGLGRPHGACLALLGMCPTLTHVDLGMNWRLPVEALGPALGQLRALTHLELGGVRIRGTAGAASLAAALPACQALEYVSLARGDTEQNFSLLTPVWPQLPALAYLNLHGHCGSDADVAGLARALPRCGALRELVLSLNEVGDLSRAALVAALPLCPRLARLEARDAVYTEEDGEWWALTGAQAAELEAAWAPRAADGLQIA
jgi:hypothetical protein